MKIKLFSALLALTLFPVLAQAQIGDITNPLNGRITVVDAGTCSTANSFVTQQLPQNASTTTVNLSGTFTATLTARLSNNGGATWTTGGAVAAGTTSFSTNGFTHICVDATAFTSGTVLVSISTGILQVQSVVAGGSSSSSLSGTNVIDTTSSKYATPIGHTIPDATFTSGAATIDCTFSNDCNFVAGTDNGSVCYGTNFTTDISILNPTSVVLARGLLTVTGAQTATCSGGNSTASTVHNGTFVWGKLGHTQLNLAYADCMAQNGCTLLLPSGLVLIESAVGNTDCLTCLEGVGYGRIQVRGWGQTISQLAPTPSFDATGCTGGPSGDQTGCIFSGTSIQMSDFGIFGAGQAAIGAGFNGKTAVIVQGGGGAGGSANSYLNSLLFLGWGATTTGFIGLKVRTESDTTLHDVHLDGVGSIGCSMFGQFANSLTTMEGSYCAVTNDTSLLVNSGLVSSHGGVYGWTNSQNGTIRVTGGRFVSSGDTIPYQTSSVNFSAHIWCNGGTCVVDGDYIFNGSANGAGFSIGSGSTAYVSNSLINANTPVITGGATSHYISLGGNVVTSTVKAYNIATFGGTVRTDPRDILVTGPIGDIVPTLTSTGTGTTPCVPTATTGSTNDKGSFTCTLVAGSGTTGTFVLNFAGAFSGATGSAPKCGLILKNGTSSWTAPATVIEGTTSTTSYTWNFTNGAALATSGTVGGTWVCTEA